MSYKWKEIEGQEWANRARYNIYRIMREKNLPASQNVIEGISSKKIYTFLSGQQDITVTKLGIIADGLHIGLTTLFKPIPENPEVLKMPYRLNQLPLPLKDQK